MENTYVRHIGLDWNILIGLRQSYPQTRFDEYADWLVWKAKVIRFDDLSN